MNYNTTRLVLSKLGNKQKLRVLSDPTIRKKLGIKLSQKEIAKMKVANRIVSAKQKGAQVLLTKKEYTNILTSNELIGLAQRAYPDYFRTFKDYSGRNKSFLLKRIDTTLDLIHHDIKTKLKKVKTALNKLA